MDFALRPATSADREWLSELRRVTMRHYVEETWHWWDDEAQTARFNDRAELAKTSIVTLDGHDAGLLHVERDSKGIFLANIQILPAFQNRGLGTALVRQLMAQGQAWGQSVRLQVLKVNTPARRLYERLGFRPTDETTTHVRMIWLPT